MPTGIRHDSRHTTPALAKNRRRKNSLKRAKKRAAGSTQPADLADNSQAEVEASSSSSGSREESEQAPAPAHVPGTMLAICDGM